MRKFGDLLMVLGVVVGTALTAAVVFRSTFPAVPWLVMVGLIKLGYIGSLGLIGAGGFVRRLAKRAEDRRERLRQAADEVGLKPGVGEAPAITPSQATTGRAPSAAQPVTPSSRRTALERKSKMRRSCA